MNGHDIAKEYGPHKYPDPDSTSDCKHGCGCWAGPNNSGGPLGLDPISGECPNNPKNNIRLGGDGDYETVVERRIRNLERRAYDAETALKKVRPSKKKLAEDLGAAQEKIYEQETFINKITALISERVKLLAES
jgi:hypothetical protein